MRITWLHQLQIDETRLQALLAVVPLGQLDALAEGDVIDVCGRQVQVQLQAAALAHALARQAQLVEVFGDAGAHAPAPAFEAALGVVRPHLSERDWGKLVQAFGLPV